MNKDLQMQLLGLAKYAGLAKLFVGNRLKAKSDSKSAQVEQEHKSEPAEPAPAEFTPSKVDNVCELIIEQWNSVEPTRIKMRSGGDPEELQECMSCFVSAKRHFGGWLVDATVTKEEFDDEEIIRNKWREQLTEPTITVALLIIRREEDGDSYLDLDQLYVR